MSNQTALFPAPQEGEKTWTRSFDLGAGQRVSVPFYTSLIEGELRDQVSLKASVRKAALRSSQKVINRFAKRGVDRLTAAETEELQWSLFICHVDQVLGGRHLALREDAEALASLVTDPAFAA